MLLTPGPTPVPEFARKAMSDITIHHRTKEFESIFEKTRNLLLEIYNMPEVLMLASSGTGAMEACVTNLTRKKALTVNSGKFGERFGKICKAFNIDYVELIVRAFFLVRFVTQASIAPVPLEASIKTSGIS